MLNDKTVLIVEDEAMIAFDLEGIVRDSGGDVAALCLDLDTAMQTASGAQFDVAILDYNIGGRTVDPVAEILRNRGIPFVFNTALAEQVELTKRYGPVEVCRKPVHESELVKALCRVLTGGRSQGLAGTSS